MESYYFTAFAKETISRIGRRSHPRLAEERLKTGAALAECEAATRQHAQLRAALGCDIPTLRTRLQICRIIYIPFLVLGFWDKRTMMCASAMPCRRYSPTTTRS